MYNVLFVQIAESLDKLSDDQGCVLFVRFAFVSQELKYFFSLDPKTKVMNTGIKWEAQLN